MRRIFKTPKRTLAIFAGTWVILAVVNAISGQWGDAYEDVVLLLFLLVGFGLGEEHVRSELRGPAREALRLARRLKDQA